VKQLVILVIVSHFFGGCCTSQNAHFTANVRAQAECAQDIIRGQLISPDKLKKDVNFLFKTIEDIHPNMYAYISQKEFSKHLAKLYEQINRPMSRLAFYKFLAPTVAQLRSGHTLVYPFSHEFRSHLTRDGKIFPISVCFNRNQVILLNNFGAEDLPLGGTLLEINGKDAGLEITRYSSYFAAECRNANPMVIQQNKLLWALLWLEYGDYDPIQLKIRNIKGCIKTYRVNPIPFHEVKNMQLQNADPNSELWSYRFLQEEKVCLIKIKSFRKNPGFQKFLLDIFCNHKMQKIENLIIDVRGNPGGSDINSTALLKYLTDHPIRECEELGIKFSSQFCKANPGILEELQKNFPEKKIAVGSYFQFPVKYFREESSIQENPWRFRGKVWVLIDSGTASTSVMFASSIRKMNIGTLIGAETMDTTSLYGECFPIKLPNTGLKASVACKYFLLNGGVTDCRGLIPDYEVRQNPEDTAKGIDAPLEFTLELIKEENK
jgi:hypothetical protein